MNFFIGLDVGGTNIKSGVILENGTILNENINMSDSSANQDNETILNNIFNSLF